LEWQTVTDADAPVYFDRWAHPSPVLDRLGSFWQHRQDPLLIGFHVDEYKRNARGFLHAGVVATIADVAIGHALAGGTDPPTLLVTVNLSCDYLGTAAADSWVEGRITPIRVGRRMATGSCTFTAGPHIVATARGLFLPVEGCRELRLNAAGG
jgi:acyl-coenzyme A thioesterase PaaI-like protein